MPNSLDDTFLRLRRVLDRHRSKLAAVHDTGEIFHLDTKHLQENGKPLFFGAVTKKKSMVSFHLMPVYLFPELLEKISPALRRRMQGKSCFNFKAVDEPLMKELEQVTNAGFDRYRKEGYV